MPQVPAWTKSVIALVAGVTPYLRRLWRERAAGRGSTGTPAPTEEEKTLSRLRGASGLDRVLRPIIAPLLLADERARLWLLEPATAEWSTALARAEPHGPQAQELRRKLAQSYELFTGRVTEGYAAVAALERMLIAGTTGTLGIESAQLAALIQSEGKARRRHATDVLENGSLAVDDHSRKVEARLAPIKARRRLEDGYSGREIRILALAVQEGDLTSARPAVKAQVFYWAARILASTSPADAQSYLDRARSCDSELDCTVVDALIAEGRGDLTSALRILQKNPHPDACSTAFVVLHRKRNAQAALDWLETLPPPLEGHLTGFGWANVGLALARVGDWNRAAEMLRRGRSAATDWPDLAYLGGLVTAAFLLPEEHRHVVLEMNVFHRGLHTLEGSVADRYRSESKEWFEVAERLFRRDQDPRLDATKLWLVWLKLTDPSPEVAGAARREVSTRAGDVNEAARLMPMLLRFELPFDESAVLQHLESRAAQLPLEPHEHFAFANLKERTLPPDRFADFLEAARPELALILPPDQLAAWRIRACAAAGRDGEARVLLNQSLSVLGEDLAERVRVGLDANAGSDPSTSLEQIYARTGELWDLHNLVEHLGAARRWVELLPHLRDLHAREPTVRNARRLISCLQHTDRLDSKRLLDELDLLEEFVERDLELRATRAWERFREGHLARARDDLQILRAQRSDATDLQLEINLTVQTGDWEALAGIVDREIEHSGTADSQALLRLAGLAAEVDLTPDRAMQLTRQAAAKDDAQAATLVQAVGMAYRLGQEDAEVARWLDRAREASSPDQGPLIAVDVRTLVEEWFPQNRALTREVEESWSKGEVPLHYAARQLHTPLVRLLWDLVRRNRALSDGRERSFVPAVAGSRQDAAFDGVSALGVDITTLLLWHDLRILESTFEAFELWLPFDVMELLLSERQQVRFHQPSLVRAASRLRARIDQGQLQVLRDPADPPGWLVDEVGLETAEALELAREQSGWLICSLPVSKLGSFLSEPACLREYEVAAAGLSELVEALRTAGHLDTARYEAARAYREAWARAPAHTGVPRPLPPGPLVIDGSALGQLRASGLLDALLEAGLTVALHPSVEREQVALIQAGEAGDELAREVDRLRVTLKHGIHRGRVQFIPAARRRRKPWEGGRIPSLFDLLSDTASYDAVAIDDRFLNKRSSVRDEKGRVIPTVSTLDVLRLLEDKGQLSRELHYAALHNLRRGGIAFVGVSAGELESRLRASPGHDEFTESIELRTLRQYIGQLRSTGLLQPTIDGDFVARLNVASVETIRRLWADPDLGIERTQALTVYIWRHVAQDSAWWFSSSGAPAGRPSERNLVLAALSHPLPIADLDRRDAWWSWLEREVLSPLIDVEPDLLDDIAAVSSEMLEQWLDSNVGREEVVAGLLDNAVLPALRDAIARNAAVSARLGVRSLTVWEIDGLRVTEASILEAARDCLSEPPPRTVEVPGTGLLLENADQELLLREAGQHARWMVDLTPLKVLSGGAAQRAAGIQYLRGSLAPWGLAYASLLEELSARSASESEASSLLSECGKGPRGTFEALRLKVQSGQGRWPDLIGPTLGFLERAYAPDPGDMSLEAYAAGPLTAHRQQLLRDDYCAGLEFVLRGAVDESVTPFELIAEASDDLLWQAITSANPSTDPYSLLAALEVALSRQHDRRFVEFAESAVDRLTSPQFDRPDGTDGYQLFALAAAHLAGALARLPGGPNRAPYWRRFVALTHAGMVLRLLDGYTIDASALDALKHSVLPPEVQLLQLVDLRIAPGGLWGDSAEAVRRDVLRRVLRLRVAFEAGEDRGFPAGEGLDRALEAADIADPTRLLSSLLELGPIQRLSPGIALRPLSAELSTGMEDAEPEQLLQRAAAVATVFELPMPVRSKLDVNGIGDWPGALPNAAVIASGQRDTRLATLVGSQLIDAAGRLTGEGDVSRRVMLLLLAASAHSEPDGWQEWMEAQLTSLARGLPYGSACTELLVLLRALRRVAGAGATFARSAEAIASAGAASPW